MSKKKKIQAGAPSPPIITTQPPSSLKRAVKWISITVLICASLSGLMAFFPVLTIDVGTPQDPNNPFSYPFIVTNNMVVPLFGVTIVCREEGTFEGGETFDNKSNAEEILSMMGPHRKTTAPCHKGFDMKAPLASGTVSIGVSYSPFLWPFKMSAIRQFKTDMNADKNSIWLPQVKE
jgi:hypothetical protein